MSDECPRDARTKAFYEFYDSAADCIEAGRFRPAARALFVLAENLMLDHASYLALRGKHFRELQRLEELDEWAMLENRHPVLPPGPVELEQLRQLLLDLWTEAERG